MSERTTFAVETAGYWYGESRRAQKEGRMSDAVLCMTNAFNHTENALFATRKAPLREVLKLAREKLVIYREHSDGSYQGGMEHRMLMDLIDKTLKG